MVKKIILMILALATIWFIGDTNLKGNSVYYAKHSLSSNVRDLELMMFTENLDHLGKKDGFKYKHKIQEIKTVQNVEKNVYFTYQFYENAHTYNYGDDKRKHYYFDENFKLKEVVDVGNNRQHIDISTVDENKIKEEIYEDFKPILKESEENKPFINLQWIFNWVYRDRIK
ncbi:hypothetical protein [Gemella haemolysans]|uniref:hypothetical protein n=1 Tax=Gemella haemolysans TaxID=1379 RepID=UPI0028D420EF|nr:hypothetical protein [Gemella haemolysans]